MSVRRSDLQKLAQIRMEEAILLLNHKKYSGAYYLSGYSIELALKACIARQFRENEIPDKNLVNGAYSHSIRDLVSLAGLGPSLRHEQDRDAKFQAYWGILGEWSVESRYSAIEPMATQLLMTAISDSKHGVFRWIKTYW